MNIQLISRFKSTRLYANRHRGYFALYLLIYLPWFFILDNTIKIDHPRMHIIQNSLDAKIPFCEYFVIPYEFWFVYLVLACLFIVIAADYKEFLRFSLSLIIGMTSSLIFYMIYPNGLNLRPEFSDINNNICGSVVKHLYSIDSPTNVFPSLHVYTSLAACIGIIKCKCLKGRYFVKSLIIFLCAMICISTVFIKQHSVSDVIGGCVLMVIMYIVIYIINWEKLFKKKIS